MIKKITHPLSHVNVMIPTLHRFLTMHIRQQPHKRHNPINSPPQIRHRRCKERSTSQPSVQERHALLDPSVHELGLATITMAMAVAFVEGGEFGGEAEVLEDEVEDLGGSDSCFHRVEDERMVVVGE